MSGWSRQPRNRGKYYREHLLDQAVGRHAKRAGGCPRGKPGCAGMMDQAPSPILEPKTRSGSWPSMIGGRLEIANLFQWDSRAKVARSFVVSA